MYMYYIVHYFKSSSFFTWKMNVAYKIQNLDYAHIVSVKWNLDCSIMEFEFVYAMIGCSYGAPWYKHYSMYGC